jgi:ATP-binding cassette subfamily F protein 3
MFRKITLHSTIHHMILLQNISKSFANRIILKNTSFHSPEKSRVALIGNNGAGKTTLLNILCGFDKDYDGQIVRPKSLRLGYLPQNFNQNPEESLLKEALKGATDLGECIREREECLERMSSGDCDQKLFDRYEYLEQRFADLGGYEIENQAATILKGLGFKEEQLQDSPKMLSGGWRMRIEFAKMLLNRPNFLILDEPTNHLDLPSIEWFEGYLQKFDGTILFVSHDRDLLNRLSTHVLHLRNGELTAYTGNFDSFLEEFSLKQSQNSNVAKHLEKEYEHIESFVNRFRASPSKARQVQSRLKMLAKIKVLEDNLEFEKISDTMSIKIENPHPCGKEVIRLEKLCVGYDKPLIKNLSLTVNRGTRLAILGANGLGKSTLMKVIFGSMQPLSGDISFGPKVVAGYFAQEHSNELNENLSILDNMKEIAPNVKEIEARKLMANLGIYGDDIFKKVKILSGGEKSRAVLASILLKKPNLLFLDEPTNHLDLSACEIFADSLTEYTGTVIFISHNRAFIETVATDRLVLEQNGKFR